MKKFFVVNLFVFIFLVVYVVGEVIIVYKDF